MYRSFLMAGFDGAMPIDKFGRRLDAVASSGHDLNLESDYRLLADVGIHTVRESVRWPVIDHGGKYDFRSLVHIIDACNRTGMEPIFDLFHFGYPEDLDPFSGEFVKRFADYCFSTALIVAGRLDGSVTFSPVSEPSYFAWAAGEAELFAPHCHGRSFELKVWLAKAAIAGIEAIWAACPGSRILNVDQICRTVAPRGAPLLADCAHAFNESTVFQSWDMIAGRLMPEMGGSLRHLDLVGINFGHENQWEYNDRSLFLVPEDSRYWPLRDLVRWVWHRYGAEMVIAQTGHEGEHRAPWVREMTAEAQAILKEGIPLHGLCLYPILGNPGDVYPKGMWDLEPFEGRLVRKLHEPMLDAVLDSQECLKGLYAPEPARKRLVKALIGAQSGIDPFGSESKANSPT